MKFKYGTSGWTWHGHSICITKPVMVSETYYVDVCDGGEDKYRFGFNGMEKDNEMKGIGNSLDFGARIYDSRLGRWMSVDPKKELLQHLSPYHYALNSPIITIDQDGEFPIFINGNTPFDDNLRASPTYWGNTFLDMISQETGYTMGCFFNGNSEGKSRFSGDFYFVDGNRGHFTMNKDGGLLASDRRIAGIYRGSIDAVEVWMKMKENMVDGKVSEKLQIITHSRGASFSIGYTSSLMNSIEALAKKEGIEFTYPVNEMIEYTLNIAPHQSNSLYYLKGGSKNINVSHVGDPLSGNDAKGNVINIHSIPEEDMGPLKQHQLRSYHNQVKLLLGILKNKKINKSNLENKVKDAYIEYDKNRNNGGKSKVRNGNW